MKAIGNKLPLEYNKVVDVSKPLNKYSETMLKKLLQ